MKCIILQMFFFFCFGFFFLVKICKCFASFQLKRFLPPFLRLESGAGEKRISYLSGSPDIAENIKAIVGEIS